MYQSKWRHQVSISGVSSVSAAAAKAASENNRKHGRKSKRGVAIINDVSISTSAQHGRQRMYGV